MQTQKLVGLSFSCLEIDGCSLLWSGNSIASACFNSSRR